jgi:hypothetical protein
VGAQALSEQFMRSTYAWSLVAASDNYGQIMTIIDGRSRPQQIAYPFTDFSCASIGAYQFVTRVTTPILSNDYFLRRGSISGVGCKSTAHISSGGYLEKCGSLLECKARRFREA